MVNVRSVLPVLLCCSPSSRCLSCPAPLQSQQVLVGISSSVRTRASPVGRPQAGPWKAAACPLGRSCSPEQSPAQCCRGTGVSPTTATHKGRDTPLLCLAGCRTMSSSRPTCGGSEWGVGAAGPGGGSAGGGQHVGESQPLTSPPLAPCSYSHALDGMYRVLREGEAALAVGGGEPALQECCGGLLWDSSGEGRGRGSHGPVGLRASLQHLAMAQGMAAQPHRCERRCLGAAGINELEQAGGMSSSGRGWS